MSRHHKNTIKGVLLILGLALLIKVSWFHVFNHQPWYVDKGGVVMIDYDATDKDWMECYQEWKALKAEDTK